MFIWNKVLKVIHVQSDCFKIALKKTQHSNILMLILPEECFHNISKLHLIRLEPHAMNLVLFPSYLSCVTQNYYVGHCSFICFYFILLLDSQLGSSTVEASCANYSFLVFFPVHLLAVKEINYQLSEEQIFTNKCQSLASAETGSVKE